MDSEWGEFRLSALSFLTGISLNGVPLSPKPIPEPAMLERPKRELSQDELMRKAASAGAALLTDNGAGVGTGRRDSIVGPRALMRGSTFAGLPTLPTKPVLHKSASDYDMLELHLRLEGKKSERLAAALQFLLGIKVETPQQQAFSITEDKSDDHSEHNHDPLTDDNLGDNSTRIIPVQKLHTAQNDVGRLLNNVRVVLVLTKDAGAGDSHAQPPSAPVHVFSVLRYEPGDATKAQEIETIREEDSIFQRKAGTHSYDSLLNPLHSARHPHGAESATGKYNPMFLDDPSLRSGRTRTVMNLPGLMFSVLPYVDPAELKRQVNEHFRERHEAWLHPSITLSKIRAVKHVLLQVTMALDLEMSTLALAIVCFEKLIIRNKIYARDFKRVGGMCLVLANKFNGRVNSSNRALYEAIANKMSISYDEFKDIEFDVFAQLDFDLHVPLDQLMPHFRRICRVVDKLPEEYDFSIEQKALAFDWENDAEAPGGMEFDSADSLD